MIDDAAKLEDELIGLKRNGETLFRLDPLTDALGIEKDPDDLIFFPNSNGIALNEPFQGLYWKEDGEAFVTPDGAMKVADKTNLPQPKTDRLDTWTSRVQKGELPEESPRQVWSEDSAPGQLLSLFRGHDVRVVEGENTPWIVLSDVASALGYSYTRNVDRAVSDRHKGRHNVTTPGGPQEMKCVSRKGILEGVFNLSPREPEKRVVVERFRDWALDVLVEVLQTGSYDAQDDTGDDASIWDLRDLLREWIDAAVERGYVPMSGMAYWALYKRLNSEHDIDAAALMEERGTSSRIKALNHAELDTAIRTAASLWDDPA